jgi:hypothetical protein
MSKLTHPGRLHGPVSHRHTVIRSACLLIRSLVPSALVPSQHGGSLSKWRSRIRAVTVDLLWVGGDGGGRGDVEFKGLRRVPRLGNRLVTSQSTPDHVSLVCTIINRIFLIYFGQISASSCVLHRCQSTASSRMVRRAEDRLLSHTTILHSVYGGPPALRRGNSGP